MATPGLIDTSNLPTIALVGRVNVGKSTLFNRFIEEQKAIVSDIPGTTRTSNTGIVLWRGREIRLVDTGGLTFDEDIDFETDIRKQAERAIKDADLILFVVDVHVGLLPQDRLLAKLLRNKAKTPIVLLANKADNEKIEGSLDLDGWKALGFGVPFLISGKNGRNTGDLLDVVFTKLNKSKRRPKIVTDLEPPIQVALIGKPNVGKSSLFNQLIGEDKVIVSPIAHTTREPHDTLMEYKTDTKTYRINMIDTAGIRRKANVEGELEQQGIGKSIETIEKSDIVLFVLDGTEPISAQDMQLGGLLEKRSKSVILLLNKWDLSEDNSDQRRNEVKKMILRYFPHLHFAPILLVSGKTGYRVHQIFPELIHAWHARHTEIPERALEHFMRFVIKKHRPSRGKGTRSPEILGFHQIKTNPPIFELFIKVKTSLNMSYVHFIENKLREQFEFFAVPIVIKLTKMKK